MRADESRLDAFEFASQIQREYGTPTPEDLALINARHAVKELAADEIFVFPHVPSTAMVDSHLTAMAPSTLQNYANEAAAGVPFMNSHRIRGGSIFGAGNAELPMGFSFRGQVEGDGPEMRVLAWDYLLRNHQPNGAGGPASNDLIRSIEAGILRSISVGFSIHPDGWLRCSICGKNSLEDDSERHFPGKTYEIDGVPRMAYDWVENAHMHEHSGVFKGSTPGAVIQRAQRLFAAGHASRADMLGLETRTGVRVFTRYPGVDLDQLARRERTDPDDVAVRGAIAPHTTPMQPPDTAWDGPEQRAKAEPKALHSMAAWTDPDKADVKEGYKLLHHSADGNHPVNLHGVNNAMSRLPGTDIPPGDKPGVEKHLRHHQEQFKAERWAATDDNGGNRMTPHEFAQSLGITIDEDASWDRAAAAIKEAHAAAEARAVKELNERIVSLDERAKLGDQAVTEMRTEVLDAGVRALGEDFDRASFEVTLAGTRDIAALRKMRDGFDARARKAFGSDAQPTSMRTSQPVTHLAQPQAERRRSAPADAFKTGLGRVSTAR